MRGGGLIAVCVALLVALAAPSSADEGQAQKAMVRGVDALTRGDAAIALGEFQQAQKLVPGAPVPYRYAGKALEALGRWSEAIASYETYLRIRPTSKDAAEIRTRIDEIRKKYLLGIVDVLCTPSGAEVRVDAAEASVGQTPLRGLELAKGQHQLTLRAKAHVDKRVSVTVVAGTTVQVQCELTKVPPPPPPKRVVPLVPGPAARPAVPPRRRARKKSWYKRPWVWVAAGSALVIGGTSFYLTRPDLPSTVGGDVHFP